MKRALRVTFDTSEREQQPTSKGTTNQHLDRTRTKNGSSTVFFFFFSLSSVRTMQSGAIIPRALVLAVLLAAGGCRSSPGDEAGDPQQVANGAFVPHLVAEDGLVPRSWKLGNRFAQKGARPAPAASNAPPPPPPSPPDHHVATRRNHVAAPPGMITPLVRLVAGDEERRWWKRRRQRVRQQRAAEIPSAGVNRQSIVLTSSDAAALQEPSEAPPLPPSPSSATSEHYDASEASLTSPTSTETVLMTSIDHDSETFVDEVAPTETSGTSTTSEATTTATTTRTTTTIAATTTTATMTTNSPAASSTAVATGANSEEYVADDHAAAAGNDNVPTLDPGDESDKSSVRLSNETSTEKTMDEATSRAPMASEFASRASAAVGRVLTQEENVPWPEAKSTKVIGTIIEDIQSPYQSDRHDAITAAALTGSAIATIVICAFLIVVTTAGASGYWWYRRRYLNRPETLNDRYAPSETGGNGDDIFRVGYIHSPEMPRDSSEEMYSLDNDSFLTSLEAMTIPTYWTETIKHTKL